MKTSAVPSQTLYISHIQLLLNKSFHTNLFVLQDPTENTVNYHPVKTHKFTVSFRCNEQVCKKTFGGLADQNIPEIHLQQIGAHMIFTVEEQPFDPVPYKQSHKKYHKNNGFYVELLQGGFYNFMKVPKLFGLLKYLLQKVQSSTQKFKNYAEVEAQILTEKETGNIGLYGLKIQQLVQEGLVC